MPFKLVKPFPPLCRHKDHLPPDIRTLNHYDPGEYEHECPDCHEKRFFQVLEHYDKDGAVTKASFEVTYTNRARG